MANITVSELYINSKQMPTPAAEGVTITREKIWSEDTGRTADGGMTGTIIAIKTKMSIRWALLTPAQVATIEAAVSDGGHPFVPMKFTDATGATVTKTMYFGTPTYTVYSWANGRQYLRDVSVTGIEQ